MNPQLRLVCATRLSRERFWEESLLGRSLSAFPDRYLPELAIQFDNVDAPHSDDAGSKPKAAEGLSSFYNRVLSSTPDTTDLLFVHDDVFIHDVFLKARLQEAFRRFDVVGLAGSRGGNLQMPSWGLAFHPDTLAFIGWQNTPIHLSGAVGHLVESYGSPRLDTGAAPDTMMSVYGPTPDFCTLLDGLFLAVRTRKLRETGVRFDPRFRFHCYDIDFCRQATDAGILMGTWPIFVTHGSGGDFSCESFKAEARAYLDKWALDEPTPIALRPRPAPPTWKPAPLPELPSPLSLPEHP